MMQPKKCKYTPLENYLRQLIANRNELALSFEQMEAVMHSKLPKSAYTRLNWWDNTVQNALSHKHAWLHAGWKVDQVDLSGKRIHFVSNKERK